MSSDISPGYLAEYIRLAGHVGLDHSDHSLPGLEDDAETWWTHVPTILPISCASYYD